MSAALELAQKKVQERARAKVDKLFLANDVLGYDFIETTHKDLFDLYPAFTDAKSWVDQNPDGDILVLWPRGHYKTTAIIVVIIQAIINNPDITILLMQGSVGVTQTLLKQIKSHFMGEAEGSRFKDLFPEFCGTKEELGPKPSMQFTVPCRKHKQIAQATCTVASPRSIKTGQHYDLGVFDDLLNESNYRNPKLLAKVQEDFTSARPLINPGCPVWVSGTRWAFGDLYEQIQRWDNDNGNWKISIKTCWTDSNEVRFPRYTKKNGQLGGFLRDDLERMQKDDPSAFACQYLLQPIHSSQAIISKEQMELAKIPAPEAPLLSQPIFMVDLAATDGVKSDDSVIAVGKMDTLGVSYITDQRGGQWIPMELALNVIDMALIHRPAKIFFEKTPSCLYFIDFLKLLARQKNIFLPIDVTKVDNRADAKNIRVASWAAMVKRGRMKFFAGIPKWDRLVEQACEFPKGRYGHDDYPDTAALLFQELSREFMPLPMAPRPVNPIIAMVQDADRQIEKLLRLKEFEDTDHTDCVGLLD